MNNEIREHTDVNRHILLTNLCSIRIWG